MSTLAPWSVADAPLTGVTLIEASAGTGKTHTIATLVLRLLLEAELPLAQILVVTYTRAATAELRLRVRKRLSEALAAFEDHPESSAVVDPALLGLVDRAQKSAQGALHRARLSDALRSFDEAPIFTIHGFCQRVLKRHAFESRMPFEAELRDDQELLIEELVCDFWAGQLAAASEHFVAALGAHKIDIAHLVRLVKRARANPDLQVIPGAEREDSRALEADYERERAEVERLFQAHAADVMLLVGQPGMNQSTYGREAMRSLILDVLPRAGGLSACDLPDGVASLMASGLKCNKGQKPPRHVCFDAVERWVTAARALAGVLDRQLVAFQHALLGYARAELVRRGEQTGSLDYDDLLTRLSEALDSPAGPELAARIRAAYPAALIDEFQDTDPVQCDVFRRIYTANLPSQRPGSLFLIGDPKQAIYAFRGADVFAYIAAASSGVDRGYTLQTNYRSDPGLLRGIDAVFGRSRAPFVFPEIGYRSMEPAPSARDRLSGAGAPLQLLFAARPEDAAKSTTKARAETALPRRLAAEISDLLQSGALLDGRVIEPRQIAVLCRTNAQAQRMQVALRELAIPAVLDGDSSVFDSAMAEELSRWLWALVEPGDGARVRSALATRGIGLSADELLALEDDEVGWDAWVGRFHALQELWHTRGFIRALHELCGSLGVPARLLALPDGERRYTDLMHIAELLHAEALHTRKGPRALLDWYRRMRSGEAKRVGMAREDVQIRLESDAHAVTLTTIHKSKGLQFPIVYCPFAWDGTLLQQHEQDSPQFHDRAAADRLTLVLASGAGVEPLQRSAAEREALAEQLRLLYVALTRAQHRLSVVWGALGKFEQSALAYLLHQDRESGDDVEELRTRTAARAKALTDAQLLEDLEGLTRAAEGAVEVRALAEGPGRAYAPTSALTGELSAREAPVLGGVGLTVSSFSQLAASDGDAIGLDRDEHVEAASGGRAEPGLAIPLAEFPAGASFGHLIHAIYETADFQVARSEDLAANVAAALRDYGAAAGALSLEDWAGRLGQALFDTLQTPLSVLPLTAAEPGGAALVQPSAAGQTALVFGEGPAPEPERAAVPMLASVVAGRRLSELEFLFPVGPGGGAGSPLTAAAIAQVLRRHARDDFERGYAQRLSGLRFAPFSGFMRGFIDLVFEHDGRFYVADYKSNHLGPTASDYAPERMRSVMQRHHYVLQYLVYSVAVHRYLALRLPGYRYDQHFGGVYYLFVRGMHPSHPIGSGIYFDRPEAALIEHLSRVFADPGARA